MSKVTISGNASGTGTLLIAAPNTNSDLVLNLPTTMGTNNGSSVVTTDAAGNLGLGVAPSAWGSGIKALQIGNYGALAVASQAFNIGSNYYSDGTNARYLNTAPAALYQQLNSVHAWYTAPSGTAGAAISFVQAMTLDASGNLLVGKTATNNNTLGVELRATGQVTSNMSQSANTTDTLTVYSTGAAAYRFYVGMGGTVFATSTTISAISDIRFKENVRDLDSGLAEVMALKPRRYDWKEGKGADIKNARGFIAQEFEQVFPDLIDEWRDPAPEGEDPYKSVRQDLIPTLVKAIQELKAIVDGQAILISAQGAEIATLKGTA